MSSFRDLTDDFAVYPQIDDEDIARARAEGFAVLVCNRPDGEEPGQPTHAAMRALAEAAGLAYRVIPVVGGPTQEAVDDTAALLDAAPGRVLAYCRSGTRSAVLWALAQAQRGAMPADAIVAAAARAGYDLAHLAPALRRLAGG